MRLGELLDHIWCDDSVTDVKPVQIYKAPADNLNRDGEWKRSAELLVWFASDFEPRLTLNERLCNAHVDFIAWMPDGIAVTVELPEENV